MKIDPYHNQKRWDNFKEKSFKKVPEKIRKEDWKLLIEFLKDMELGLNTPKGMKGKREAGTLLNLSSHNSLLLKHFKRPLTKLTKIDLHNLEKDIHDGKILKNNGQKYSAFGNYIKDFKAFWSWGIRTKRFKANITEDITSKTDKPSWVYLGEEKIKKLFNSLNLDYRVYCWFMYDSGMRVTEGMNIRIKDFTEDFSQVTISDETAKTFGRTINLKLSTQLIKDFVKEKKLKDNDLFFQNQPFGINKYLRYHCAKMFGGDKVSHPKSKGLFKNFTLYDIRHNSSCYWFSRYPTHKGLMYRFGWRKADKIEYYSEFLGVSDEICDSDMILGIDKDKLYKMEQEIKDLKKEQTEELKTLKINQNTISENHDSQITALMQQMDFLLGAKNNELPKKKISEVLKEAPQRAKEYEQLQKIKNKN